MINKKIGLLAAAILSVSSAQAAFDQGSVIFYAIDLDSQSGTTYDTFAVDLGVSAIDVKNGTVIGDNIAANAGYTNYKWGIIGTTSDTSNSVVTGGLFGSYTSYPNTGVLTSGAGSVTATEVSIASWISSVDDWVAGLASVAVGNTATQAAADPFAVTTGQTGWINGVDHTTTGSSDVLSFMGGGGTSGNDTAQFAGVGQSVSFDGSTVNVNAVPVPAAAWLFGSALVGLVVARRAK
jgi:hypothetical protein